MSDTKYTPVNRPEEVPDNRTNEESAKYWDTHEITENFLKAARSLEPSEMPAKRTEAKSISIRFDLDTLERLQELAEKKHKGYQTLLKQFVIERLYEEEKRMTKS